VKVVLLSGADRLAGQPVVDVVDELSGLGVEVRLGLWAAPSRDLRRAVPDLVAWGPAGAAATAALATTAAGTTDAVDASADVEDEAAPPAGPRPLRRRVVGRLRRVGQPARTWRRLRRDGTLLAAAGAADVLIALDAPAVLAAWKVGRRNPGPEVVYGLSAGRGVVMRLLAERGGPSGR
jgi:hypothetical protein